jgi:hypothetical protein
MFNLEQAIKEWRRQMIAVGIKSPHVLDELESHLREDLERRERAGLTPELAFENSAQQIGAAELLKPEFRKIGRISAWSEYVKHFIQTLAGIPNPTFVTTMNTMESHSHLEPRWATYLKSATFVLPAVCLWTFSTIFLFPKLNEICQHAGVRIPGVYGLMLFLSQYSLILLGAFAVMIGLLEWRSERWSRYRRVTFGVGVFVVNSIAILLITGMVVLALISASQLLQGAK